MILPLEDAPIVVGIGAAYGDEGDLEALELMVRAARAALVDAGSGREDSSSNADLAAKIDRIVVPKGSWRYTDPGSLIGQRLGAPRVTTVLGELGVSQQTLLNHALHAVASGRSRFALVVGGEAKARELRRSRSGQDPGESPQDDGSPDLHLRPSGDIVAPAEIAARIWEPVQQYALMENALRHADGASIDANGAAVARLWERFNSVARTNPRAAFPSPMSADQIAITSPSNRPLAFPYNKWHSTQWSVDQSAALVVCTASTAREAGIDPSRWIVPRVALESDFGVPLVERDALSRWPAMEVLGAVASGHLDMSLNDIPLQEIYSCFPVAVRIQQRSLGLDPDGTPTVTGGMAFAGGPFNNFVLQSIVAMGAVLREHPGTPGLVTTVSGLLTKAGLSVWSAGDREVRPILVDDLSDRCDAATERRIVDTDYVGAARVATYTVTYDKGTPARTVVIADTPDRRRAVAIREDADVALDAIRHDLIGSEVSITAGTFSP